MAQCISKVIVSEGWGGSWVGAWCGLNQLDYDEGSKLIELSIYSPEIVARYHCQDSCKMTALTSEWNVNWNGSVTSRSQAAGVYTNSDSSWSYSVSSRTSLPVMSVFYHAKPSYLSFKSFLPNGSTVADSWRKVTQGKMHVMHIESSRHFPGDIFKCVSLNKNVRVLVQMSLIFVPLT